MKIPKKLVFATNNSHKLDEIRGIMGEEYEVLSLKDIGCNDELPETSDTLEGNACQKALYVKEKYGYDCFADDTGLFVDALDGSPGIYSARYAGEECDSKANMRKLLHAMEGKDDRRARFITVIAFAQGADISCYKGIIEGEIMTTESGCDGFGYDPIFRPEGYDMTFAEMEAAEKNSISHRRRAVNEFCKYLKEKNK